jgi:hypothetical protein
MTLNGRNDAGDVIGRRKRGGDVTPDARPKLQAPRGKETRLPNSFVAKIVSGRALDFHRKRTLLSSSIVGISYDSSEYLTI